MDYRQRCSNLSIMSQINASSRSSFKLYNSPNMLITNLLTFNVFSTITDIHNPYGSIINEILDSNEICITITFEYFN